MKYIKILAATLLLVSLTGCTKVKEIVSANNSKAHNVKFDKKITFNGYTFELGCTLDSFVKHTAVEIDKKDMQNALLEKHTLKACYYKVKAIHRGFKEECTLSLYIDIRDPNKILLQGISVKSDRGYVEVEPNVVENPNIISCGFVVLGNYDINQSCFEDFTKEYRDLAVKSKNKYIDKYELRLEDNNYGINIEFNSIKGKTKKTYITDVNITNDVQLAW